MIDFVVLILACAAVGSCGEAPVKQLIMPGFVSQISARGNELWAITQYQQILRWVANQWTLIPGGATRVGAAADGHTWVVNSGQAIYRYNPAGNSWGGIGGALVQVSSAGVNNALGCNHGGQVYSWPVNSWTLLSSTPPCQQVALGDNGDMWMIDINSNLHHMTSGVWAEKQIAFNAVSVDAQNSTRVVVTDHNRYIHKFDGSNWQTMNGVSCVQVAVGYSYIYCLTQNGMVYQINA